MNIINFSINRPVTIAMIFLAAVVFGLVSLDRLRLKLLPDISYPSLTVQTEYPDAAESQEVRRVEVEFQTETSAKDTTIRGYALYNVCDKATGTCLFRRQDFAFHGNIR